MSRARTATYPSQRHERRIDRLKETLYTIARIYDAADALYAPIRKQRRSEAAKRGWATRRRGMIPTDSRNVSDYPTSDDASSPNHLEGE